MSLKTKLIGKNKFIKTGEKLPIKLPAEIGKIIEVEIDKNGRFVLFIPFEIDLRESMENNLSYFFKICEDENPVTVKSKLNPENFSPKILSKMNLLPGQKNSNAPISKRIQNLDKTFNKSKNIKRSGNSKRKTIQMKGRSVNNPYKKDKNSFIPRSEVESLKNKSAQKIISSIQSSKKAARINKPQEKKKKLKTNIAGQNLAKYDKLQYNKSLVVYKSKIDYTKLIKNKIASNIRNLNDLQAFGSRVTYVLSDPVTSQNISKSYKEKDLYVPHEVLKDNRINSEEKSYSKAEIRALSLTKRKEFNERVIKKEQREKNSSKEQVKLIKSMTSEIISLDFNKAITSNASLSYRKQIADKNSLTRESSLFTKNFKKNLGVSVDKKSSKGRKSQKTNNQSRVAKKQVKLSYVSGIDPASLVKQTLGTHITPRHIKKGTTPRKIKNRSRLSKGGYRIKSNFKDLKNKNIISKEVRLKSSFIDNIPFEYQVSDNEIENTTIVDALENSQDLNFPIAQEKIVSNRMALLYHKYTFNEDHARNEKLYCSIIIKNSSNIIVGKKNFIINFRNLINNQIPFPEEEPSFGVVNVRNFNNGKLKVKNNHYTTVECNLYQKVLTNSEFPEFTFFNHVKKVSIGPNQISNTRFTNGNQRNAELYRLTFSSRFDGKTKKFNNIVTNYVSASSSRKNNKIAAIYAYQKGDEPGITVSVKNLPEDVYCVRFNKSQISSGMRKSAGHKAKLKNNPIRYEDGTEVEFISVPDASEGITIRDVNVKDLRVYQYSVEGYTRSGKKISIANHCRIKYYKKNNIVDVEFSEVNKTRNNLMFFSLSMTKKNKSSLDKIIDDLASKNYELYKDDIARVRQASSNFLRARITLINTFNGKTIEVGDYKNNSIVSFKVSKKANYVLQIFPYEVDPEESINLLKNLLKTNSNILDIDGSVGENSSVYKSNLIRENRQNLRTIPKNRTKFLSRTTKSRGIIRSRNSQARNFRTDIYEENATGDIKTLFIASIVKYTIGVREVRKKVLPDNRVVISFAVRGNHKQVDFINITAEKEGKEYLVGACVINHDNNIYDRNVNFIDLTNVEYMGNIHYKAQFVFNNGVVSEKFDLGNTALLETRSTSRR